jgi:predicted acyl esterase
MDQDFDLRAHNTKYEYRTDARRRAAVDLGCRAERLREPLSDPAVPLTLRAGYVFVRHDVRGRLMSDGDFPALLRDARAHRARPGVAFTMPDANHVFRRGHQVIVQLHSTWFPLLDRNPQTFVDIPNATAEEYRPAIQRALR